MYGPEISSHNSQLVACGGEVVVATAGDVVAAIGVAAVDDVVVVVGAAAVVFVWMQRFLMRPCTSPQFAFVLVVVTPMRKDPSWWDR